jgi:hypothetical protein
MKFGRDLFENVAVDFRCRHFAFRGATLSLLTLRVAGSQHCRCNPAGVFVPSTAINRAYLTFCCVRTQLKNSKDLMDEVPLQNKRDTEFCTPFVSKVKTPPLFYLSSCGA